MKKNIKYIIYFLIVVISALLISIILIKINSKDTQLKENQTVNSYDIRENDTFSNINDINEYFIVKNIVDRYISNIRDLNGDSFINEKTLRTTKEEAIKIKKEKAVEFFENIIDEQQKNEKELSIEYLINNANKYKKQGDYSNSNLVYNYIINKMYKLKYKDNIDLFLISANIDEIPIDLLIKYDSINNTFSIFLSDYIEKNNCDINMDKENINLSSRNINENNYNKLIIGKKTDEDMAKEYFNIQKNNLLYNLKAEYNQLNNEYRKKRFNNYSDFENYFYSIKDSLQKSKLDEYSVETINNKEIYTLIDNSGKYYIIQKENGFENYDVFLDEYTVDSDYLKEKYNKATANEKVAININKIISSINYDDYNYFYDKLADTFKNRYFTNQENLKNYWKEHLFNKVLVEFHDFSQEGNLYTYKVRIIKKYEDGEKIPEGKNAASKNVNIVMQLKEGTDFVMSFSIDE